MISYGLVYQKGPEMEKKGIFAPPYGYLSDMFLPSASGYVLATYYRYDIDRENPKMFAGKNIENALRRLYIVGVSSYTIFGSDCSEGP